MSFLKKKTSESIDFDVFSVRCTLNHFFLKKAKRRFSGNLVGISICVGSPEEEKFLISHPSKISSGKIDFAIGRFGHCI